MRKRIVILANSFKDRERCIAGIDIKTSQWVRPVAPPSGGAVPKRLRNTNGEEPKIRDIVEISVQGPGPNNGCQPENQLLNPTPWQYIKIMPTTQLLKYCENDNVILHNDRDCVFLSHFQAIPQHQWKSLQLVRPSNTQFHEKTWDGKKKWRAVFKFGQHQRLDLGITDPVIIDRLNRDENISSDCILTISLAGPWTPDGIQPMRCYKLVAGVIEL